MKGRTRRAAGRVALAVGVLVTAVVVGSALERDARLRPADGGRVPSTWATLTPPPECAVPVEMADDGRPGAVAGGRAGAVAGCSEVLDGVPTGAGVRVPDPEPGAVARGRRAP